MPGECTGSSRCWPATRGRDKPPGTGRSPAKIVIGGGRGVGTASFERSVSDTDPVDVEAATEFGRITLHPACILHFTPNSGSWPNMVEVFFSIITLKANRSNVTSVKTSSSSSGPLWAA